MQISEEQKELNKLRKQRKLNPKQKQTVIDPKYKNLIYGFDINNANTLREIDIIYNKAVSFKSEKAKREIIGALRSRITKLKLITDQRIINSYLTLNNN